MKELVYLSYVALCIPFFGNGQHIRLEDCMRMADTANRDIRAARLDISINKKERDSYLSARLPHLSFSADYRYNALIPEQVIPGEFFGGPPGSFSTVAFGVPYNLGNTVQLSQILYNPQVEYGLAALKVNAQIKEIQLRMTELVVKQQVATSFFSLHAVNRQLSFIDSNLLNMDKLIGNMEAMWRHELVVQSEVDKLKINRLSLLSAKESLSASREQLKDYMRILLGMSPESPLELADDDLSQQSLLLDQSEIAYPELELLTAQQRMNKEERKGTNMAYLPNLALYGVYNYNYNMEPAEDYRVGTEGAIIGLKLDWTLFDGLEKVHKQKANTFQAEKLENQAAQLKEQLDMQAAVAKREIDVRARNLDLAKEQLTLAERVYKQTKAKFEQGTISSNDLILADNSLQEAQTNLVAAYINLRTAEINYLKTIGLLN